MVNADTENPTRNVSRRGVIAGMLVLPALSQAKAEMDLFEKIRHAADVLGALMQELHGGDMRVCVDHEAKTAVICPLA